MPDFNKVILMGRLCADPELKTTTSGISVTSFRLAINRKFTPKDQEKQTDFVDVVAWRQQAEFVCKYFTKGKPILVCGSLQSRNWQDKEGNKRTTIEVVADELTFVESGGGGNAGSGGAPRRDTDAPAQSQYASSYTDAGKFEEVSTDEDFPF
ncbi:MAG: single-stranded DNA-binding protein [Eubacteriales bacterium]